VASIYDLKPKFQGLLRPLVTALAKGGVTANQVTLLACLLSILTGTLLYCWPTARWALLLVPAVLFSRMALNAVDGMLAREHGQKSRLGAVLNELTDVISDAALYLPFAVVPGLDPRLVIIAVILAIIGELTGVVAIQIGAERRYDGPMGKSDRAFMFGLIALLLGLGKEPGWWLTVFQYLIVILGVVTIINRSRRALATEGTR
jgi:CDP-diacylglycerol--glycerol-3-phosphate 3-phosphatidyltransferase